MLLVIFTLGFFNFFWGEIIPAGGGFGYDGVQYAKMVQHLDLMMSGGQLSTYYAHRMLPAFVVRSILLLTDVPMSDLNVIHVFEIYNLVLLLGAALVWKRVADSISLSLSGRWIGFGAIFINYAFSKQTFYYPVLTDVTALFLAMLLLLFYIEKKPFALFFITITGAFVWPAVSVVGAFLLIFLKAILPKEVIIPLLPTFTFKNVKLGNLVKLSGIVLLVLSVCGYLLLALTNPEAEQACNVIKNQYKLTANGVRPSIMYLIQRALSGSDPCLIVGIKQLLTALPSIFGVTVLLAMLIGSKTFFLAIFAHLRRVQIQLVVLAVAAVLVPFVLGKMLSNPDLANPNSLNDLILLVLLPPDGKFLLPFVTLGVFWGPAFLLVLLFWKAFSIEARKLGPGFLAAIGIYLPLGLICEPRFLTVAWPFLVVGLVLSFENFVKKPSFKYAFSILTVLFAQFWIRHNLAPWAPPDYSGLLEYPKQLYFMHYGLWMSWSSYILQLPILVLSGFWLFKTVNKSEL